MISYPTTFGKHYKKRQDCKNHKGWIFEEKTFWNSSLSLITTPPWTEKNKSQEKVKHHYRVIVMMRVALTAVIGLHENFWLSLIRKWLRKRLRKS